MGGKEEKKQEKLPVGGKSIVLGRQKQINEVVPASPHGITVNTCISILISLNLCMIIICIFALF